MHCPYCKRKPNEIDEYKLLAKEHEMTAEDYVRMDEGTYDSKTNLYCCTSCYIHLGMPTRQQLFEAFKIYRKKVVPIN